MTEFLPENLHLRPCRGTLVPRAQSSEQPDAGSSYTRSSQSLAKCRHCDIVYRNVGCRLVHTLRGRDGFVARLDGAGVHGPVVELDLLQGPGFKVSGAQGHLAHEKTSTL
jgi:hypothetical protein